MASILKPKLNEAQKKLRNIKTLIFLALELSTTAEQKQVLLNILKEL